MRPNASDEAPDIAAPGNEAPLLETKLHVPRLRRGLVGRPRLDDRLRRGTESKLTLISAPAGFGKTTLLAEWLSSVPAADQTVAWLSLDAGDNQPASFWTYVISALQTAAPGIGATAISLLRAPQTPGIEAVLATVLNEMGTVPGEIVLVLDDYHVIDARDVHDGLVFLLEHLPQRVHLVIATRADPALPLSRLRGRGELVEIRAADLRFTPDEAAQYLNEVMGLDLAARDLTALEARTEGWIAALQLAALSMQGRDDVPGFIAGFAGDDRYIVDYLVEEVLHRQPDAVRQFLLQTSILSRLSGPLCDAVTGQTGGKAMLELLDRKNLFVVPLDDRRQWYRYHHLFGDVLRARLLDEQSERVPELHRRASVWFERHAEPFEAISHAFAGDDFVRAATLVELAVPTLRQGRQEARMRGWLEALPDELLLARPVLSVAFVGARLVSGEIEGVEGPLRSAERWLATTDAAAGGSDRSEAPSTEMVVVDQAAFRSLPHAIAVYRAAQPLALGDVAGTVTHAQRALELVGDDDHVERGSADGFLALAAWTTGDLEGAHRFWAGAMASLERAGYLSDVIGCAIALADIRIAQGRLRDAMNTYERGLQLASEHRAPVLRGAADMHVGMSSILHEWNDLDAARQNLQRSNELGEHLGLAQNPYRWRAAMARIREAEGDVDGAHDVLGEADRLYVSDYYPNVRPITARTARLWIVQGRSGEALRWARERDLSVEDELSYLREFEHLTLARALLAASAQRSADRPVAEAMTFLDGLLRAAEDGNRAGSVIEVLMLQALANQMRGDLPSALARLERAVTQAEPEGYARLFLDEGRPMAVLLSALARLRGASSYVRRLLDLIAEPIDGAPRQHGLVEPLSDRELEVLRLLGGDLDGPDIAAALFVSVNTMRTHTKNIYAKLGVNSRRAAVARAADLGLLSRTRG